MAEFQFRISEDLEGGVYSNLVSVWHTGHEFTLDFCATLQKVADDDPIKARVVSRVKLPVSVIFDLIKAINTNMTIYEATFGPIHELQVQGGDDAQQ